jgi:hypothetical protein
MCKLQHVLLNEDDSYSNVMLPDLSELVPGLVNTSTIKKGTGSVSSSSRTRSSLSNAGSTFGRSTYRDVCT